MRRAYLNGILGLFESVLNGFSWVEIPITPLVRRLAIRYVAEYSLGSQDATHLACAAVASVTDVASLDVVFRRVDDLDLRNDRIYD